MYCDYVQMSEDYEILIREKNKSKDCRRILWSSLIENVQHLPTFGLGRLDEAIDGLAHFHLVGFVSDGGQINDDVIAS